MTAATRTLRVEVAYAAPGIEARVEVQLPSDATVADAVAASGLMRRFALAPQALTFAIFGQRAQADTLLADGDRVELLRALVADPKDARRRRAGDPSMRGGGGRQAAGR
jgi:putative ubiquitin-RnfH superfamily antitoxin RatB of RatAB toxin-antitoxin module